ncbi:MAG: nucleotidyltransferase family protein [Acidimicrobiales bacterium]
MTVEARPLAGTAAVILAAGAGSRFNPGEDAGHKLLAGLHGRPVVWWSAVAALDADIGPVWVVTGAADLADALPSGVVKLANEQWSSGQASSLRTAVSKARQDGLEAVVVGLGDQPFIGAEAWRSVAASSSPIAVAIYNGRRRNPVRLSSTVWELLPAAGDEGARSLIKNRPDLVEEVPCVGEPADIDTREDLTRWS